MNEAATPAKSVKLVGAVEQAFRILRVLSASDQPMGVSAVAREAKVNPSTAFNILRTLVAETAADFDELSKTYSLGEGLLKIVGGLAERSLVVEILPELNRLAADAKCLVGLWRIDGGRMTLIERATTSLPVRLDMDIRQRLPKFGGAVGRAWAATQGLSDAKLREGFAFLQWGGSITADRFVEEVREAESAGYAVDREALYPGVVSLGAIIVRGGEPVYGLTASDIAHNLDDKRLASVGKRMAELAQDYSR